LDFKSFAEVDRLTLPEYELLIKAAKLKQIDLDYRNHLQAYLNFSVKAEKKKGKNKTEPVFKKFKQFYNYKNELKNAFIENDTNSRLDGFSAFLKKEE
jgi:hypothetical protein